MSGADLFSEPQTHVAPPKKDFSGHAGVVVTAPPATTSHPIRSVPQRRGRFGRQNGQGKGRRRDPSLMAKGRDFAGGRHALLVADGNRAVGVIYLKDIVKGGIKERFAQLRQMGIKTVMVTGDNKLTAAAIAAEAGVDDYIAQATPEQAGPHPPGTGRRQVDRDDRRRHQRCPALAPADVGVAMNTGTQAAREAGNMVDLDSNPTKLIDVVEIASSC